MLQVAVVGASGYSGAELVARLARHPHVRVSAVQAATNAGRRFESLFPEHADAFRGVLSPLDAEALRGFDVVFLALPHGAAASTAAALHERVGTVIDLSGDLRLADAAAYRQWYGREPAAPQLLGRAAYGLPELFGADLRGARLVASAGCYATVAQIAAAPALGLGEQVGADVVLSGVSGTTGAGRKADLETSYSEVAENLRAYRVGRHQHTPEITAGLQRACGRAVRLTFVPQLAPLRRGILATIVVRAPDIQATDVLERYRRSYADAPFVRVVDAAERLPQTRDVLGTNFCDVAPLVDVSAGTLVVLGVIDNLVKGAAGQAVQIMNCVWALPETTGLLPPKPEGVRDVDFQPVG